MSSEAARLVRTRWASHVRAPRALVRDFSPRIFSTGSEFELARDPLAAMARIPHLAFEHARRALARGPVLVQVASVVGLCRWLRVRRFRRVRGAVIWRSSGVVLSVVLRIGVIRRRVRLVLLRSWVVRSRMFR